MKIGLLGKIILFSLLLIPFLAQAITIPNPLTYATFEDLINSIINFIFWVAVVLVPLMIIVAGFYFLASAGNSEKIRTAKNIILYTAIGFIIVLLAKGIISVLRQIIGG